MGCPGGCVGGGGQPIPTTAEIRKKRTDAIYREDEGMEIRKSHENPYIINFECTVICPTIAITSVTPTSGPVGTVVTINASGGDLTGTTVNFGGVAATISSSSFTQLVVTVPAGALAGAMDPKIKAMGRSFVTA